MSETHRRTTRRRRWSIAAAALLVTGAVTAGALGIGAMAGFGPLASCTPAEIVVAADPAVVEPVTAALAPADGDTGVNRAAATADECVTYRVVEAAADLPGMIRAGEPGLPAVWIPDSALALDTLDSATGALATMGASLASSPVVVAVPESDSARYGDPAATVPWTAMLTDTRPPALPDPTVDHAALAGLSALRITIGDDAGRPSSDFIGAVLALARGRLPDGAAGFAALDGPDSSAFLTSEQAVVRNNRDGDERVVALSVQGGAGALDFPFVRVTAGVDGAATTSGRSASDVADAVDQLESRLRGSDGRVAFAAAGLRAPNGVRPSTVLPDEGWLGPRVSTADPRARQVAIETLGLWGTLTLPSRMLAVVDVSGSMNAPIGGGARRIDLAAGAAQGGLALFPDISSVGLWSFSDRVAPETDWQELVPLGVLTDPFQGAPTRRAALNGAASQLKDAVGGGTALYDTALAATRSVRADYEPGASHTIVLMTDGRNEVEDGIDLAGLLEALRTEADPDQPVPLITIAIGPEADTDALQQISQATGGRSYAALTADDIRTVFFDALSQRVCRPIC